MYSSEGNNLPVVPKVALTVHLTPTLQQNLPDKILSISYTVVIFLRFVYFLLAF
jgi:uncharacterized membrane protein